MKQKAGGQSHVQKAMPQQLQLDDIKDRVFGVSLVQFRLSQGHARAERLIRSFARGVDCGLWTVE
jgi:hypothetical protein